MVDANCVTSLNTHTQKLVEKIGQQAAKFNYQAYLVGGIVRDLILKRENNDLDIVIEGDAIQLARHLSKILKMQMIVHEAFKTATLTDNKGERIDLASARRELYPDPGALPVIDASNIEADMFRRDFTINALAISLNPEHFGQLVDVYGGLKDLKEGNIRVFHEESFTDDPTRVLRAVRFEQRFGFQIEGETLALLKKAIKNKNYKTVKAPRYFAEFKKILKEDEPTDALMRLRQLGALNFWDQSVKCSANRFKSVHKRISQLRRLTLYKTYSRWWLVYLIEVLSCFSEKKRKDILQKIQIKKTFIDSILDVRNDKKIIRALSKKCISKSDVYEILKVYSLDTLVYIRINTTRANIQKRIDQYLGESRKITLNIDGEDLKRLGIRNGKRMGTILKEVLYYKINKGLKTKSQEMKAVREILQS